MRERERQKAEPQLMRPATRLRRTQNAYHNLRVPRVRVTGVVRSR